MRAIAARARRLGLLRDGGTASADSTGMESRHASRHYQYRRARDPGVEVAMPDWPKVTWVLDNDSYLIGGAWAGRGPSYDAPTLSPALRLAAEHMRPAVLLADSGFDSEKNHRLARELGVRRTLIALNRRGHAGEPGTRYRRQMHRHPNRRLYGQRWHIEGSVSQHKRRFGSALRTRRPDAQRRECLFRVLLHNIALLAAV